MNYEISVAIDFGTSNCAVAYSYESDKQNVIVINDWQDGVETRGKIPTAILFDENQRFMAFGNRAIDKYREYVADEMQNECYFFQHFKMELYNKVRFLTNQILSIKVRAKKMFSLSSLIHQTFLFSDYFERIFC